MPEERKHISGGESQVTINKRWVVIIVVGLTLFVGGIGWMYQVTATARPATVHTGGY